MSKSPYPAIPQPAADVDALLRTVLALKEAVEVLTQQRGVGSADGSSGRAPAGAVTRSLIAECGSYEEMRDRIVNGHA